MPVGRGPRRIIPIQNKRSLATEFRIIGGKLYLDRPSDKGAQWASCAAKDSITRPQFATMGSNPGISARFFLSYEPPKIEIAYQIGIQANYIPAQSTGSAGNLPISKPRFTRFNPSCIDDKLKQRK